MKLLSLVFIFIVSSCCTKMYCVEPRATIVLKGFFENEIDTISILLIDNNRIDTLNVISGDSIIPLKNNPKYATEYIIKVGKLNQEYKISNFKYKQVGCNSCFPKRPKSDYYDVLDSYTINGKQQYARNILIQK